MSLRKFVMSWPCALLFNVSPCRNSCAGELERIASRPSVAAWLQGVRERKAVAETGLSPGKFSAPVMPIESDVSH